MNNNRSLIFSASLCLGRSGVSSLRTLRLCGIFLLFALNIAAQIPQPKDVLGFTPGDDRKLASWAQTVEYFKKLDTASDRMQFQEIGKTTMGAPFVYATISAPENLKDLEKYKQINAKLADPRKIGAGTILSPSAQSADRTAAQLIKQGKTIVLITCGVHSDEVGSELSSMLIAYKLLSSNDPETLIILKNTIILLVPSLNPDGVDIVKNWYDKTLGTKFEGTDPPELYNKYVGHDDNRDWYAFTQIETQLTVDKIHNVWHPQIVHDIHQQGEFGSRLFLPPYMQPVEPNVPKQIVDGYTELGNYMAADLRKQGFQGITTDSTYDAWTPSRAYSHYHGGVRILSETASCKLATPITVKFEDLRPGQNYDPRKEAPNFGPVWKGGEWHIGDITRYMTTAAFSLLTNAANEREKWLTRFYEIGKEAVRPAKHGQEYGFLIDDDDGSSADWVAGILERGGVKSIYTFKGYLIPLAQPYGKFAKALLEKQVYPDLRDKNGNPVAPYDVTAHTLSLLIHARSTEVIAPYSYRRAYRAAGAGGCPVKVNTNALYKSFVPSMDEGWTRFTFENQERCAQYQTITNSSLRSGSIPGNIKNIIFPDQSPNQILNGFAKGSMPDEYTGGVGKDGVENLKKFIEAGGTLVFLNRASDFAIEQFNLPLRDVTKGLARKDFYIPGSILRTELDLSSPIAKGMPKASIAWFEGSPAFELSEPPPSGGGQSATTNWPPANAGGSDKNPRIHIIARYPSDPKAILLSGWALGAEKIAGTAALVQVNMGKGKIILFGFRPQYRGQSLATFPLLFNAISQ